MDELNGLTDSIEMKRSLTSPSGPGSSTENFEERMKLGLETLRRGETILRSRDTTLYEQDLVDFWVEHYDKDRSRRKLWNRNLLSDRAKRQDPFIDNLRPPTPDPPEEYAADEKLKKGWYANYRRGYEFTLEQANIKLKKRLTAMPMVEGVAALTPKKIIAVVDKVKPGLEWENERDYAQLKDYYFQVRPGESQETNLDIYVLRVDVPDNYPSPETLEKENKSYKVFMNDSDYEEEYEADEQAARDERAEQVKQAEEVERTRRVEEALRLKEQAQTRQEIRNNYIGSKQNGFILNDSHNVLKLNDDHSDSLYVSICILRTMQGRSSQNTSSFLRKLAIDWIQDSAGKMQNELFYSPTAPFPNFFFGQVPIGIKENNPSLWKYVFGMKRANLQAINGLGNTSTSVLGTSQADVVKTYCQSQRRDYSWATMYDAEALAYALPEEREIHLYTNNNIINKDAIDPADVYLQDWNTIDERDVIRLGRRDAAGSSSGNIRGSPYRLLWSADHQMRFRPLIEKGDGPNDNILLTAENLRDTTCKNPDLDFNRDDRAAEQLPANYYSTDYWCGRYNHPLQVTTIP